MQEQIIQTESFSIHKENQPLSKALSAGIFALYLVNINKNENCLSFVSYQYNQLFLKNLGVNFSR